MKSAIGDKRTPQIDRATQNLPSGFRAELGLGAISETDLVSASFRFLLDREPATSILARFSLGVIPRYFPDYRNDIRKYV